MSASWSWTPISDWPTSTFCAGSRRDTIWATCWRAVATLADAVVNGPGNIQIVPGAHAIRTGSEDLLEGPARLVAELGELESEADFVLVDAGSGLGPGVAMLAAAADQVVIVSTTEPTSIADAHAAISRFRRLAIPPRLRVVVNQAGSASEAAEVLDRLVNSSRQFQGAVVSPLGPGRFGPTLTYRSRSAAGSHS